MGRTEQGLTVDAAGPGYYYFLHTCLPTVFLLGVGVAPNSLFTICSHEGEVLRPLHATPISSLPASAPSSAPSAQAPLGPLELPMFMFGRPC